jgi:hypothetical protein
MHGRKPGQRRGEAETGSQGDDDDPCSTMM